MLTSLTNCSRDESRFERGHRFHFHFHLIFFSSHFPHPAHVCVAGGHLSEADGDSPTVGSGAVRTDPDAIASHVAFSFKKTKQPPRCRDVNVILYFSTRTVSVEHSICPVVFFSRYNIGWDVEHRRRVNTNAARCSTTTTTTTVEVQRVDSLPVVRALTDDSESLVQVERVLDQIFSLRRDCCSTTAVNVRALGQS